MKLFFLGRRWTSNQRKSNSVCYNTPLWKIIALICCARRSPKVTLITVFVSIVAWTQARWPPLFIAFLISPCLVTSTYQVSSEIYGGFFYLGITLNNYRVTLKWNHNLTTTVLIYVKLFQWSRFVVLELNFILKREFPQQNNGSVGSRWQTCQACPTHRPFLKSFVNNCARWW